jgi:hypothetical protein
VRHVAAAAAGDEDLGADPRCAVEDDGAGLCATSWLGPGGAALRLRGEDRRREAGGAAADDGDVAVGIRRVCGQGTSSKSKPTWRKC